MSDRLYFEINMFTVESMNNLSKNEYQRVNILYPIC